MLQITVKTIHTPKYREHSKTVSMWTPYSAQKNHTESTSADLLRNNIREQWCGPSRYSHGNTIASLLHNAGNIT